jgi:preprotein translocase subunit SecD
VRQRAERTLLLCIIALTVFSLVTVWPSEPWRYLPESIPWPEGQGIKIPFIKLSGAAIEGTTLERRAMRLGLDLRGGTRLVLEADTSGQPDVDLDQALDGAADIIERRVNAFGVAESEIQRQGSNRLAVQLPGIEASEAISKIGKTALLEFRELQRDDEGNVAVYQDGEIVFVPMPQPESDDDPTYAQRYSQMLEIAVWVPSRATGRDGLEKELTGRYLSKAYLGTDQAGFPAVDFELSGEGAHLFGQISERLLGQPLAFFLDGEPIRGSDGGVEAPTVRAVITDKGQITGLSFEEADYLTKLLRAGAMPVPLKVIQQEDVDATLGEDSVQKSVIAGEVAMLIIMLFMILYYRLPGLLATLALFVYTTVVLAVFKLWPVTLTLAGIAAFVLSVGMAVDANILIFERMKEELRVGRSLVIALEEGFNRAWSSIRDSNISTLITCAILFWFGDQFGASLVKGFALTLAIGVIISMFSAILVTRTFLRLIIGTPLARRPGLWAADLPAKTAIGEREAGGLPIGGGQ